MRYALLLFAFLLATPAYAEDPVQVTNVHRAITSQNVWLNTSRKIEPEDLKGRIILLDFWTLGCINCMHIIPDLKALEEEFGDKITVIGVHSAKFADERDTASIRAAILRYGLKHAVVNDFDFTIWKKFGVNAWPTLVLIGPLGVIDNAYAGEGNRAAIETDIKALEQKYAGRINTSPFPIALESGKQPETVLSFPGKIIALDDKRLAIADSGHDRIVIAGTDGSIQQIIGSSKEGLRDGSFKDAQFFKPQGMAFKDNILYIADTSNHALRTADLSKQTVTTLAGTGKQGNNYTPHDAPARSTAISSPWDVAFYPDTNHLAIAMAGTHQLVSYDIGARTLSLLAGNGQESIEDGSMPHNSLSQPSGLSVLGSTLYFTDAETSALRSLKDGNITTLIGTGLFDFGYKEGDRKTALMQHCLGLAVDGNDVYLTDTYNHSIRRYDIKEAKLYNYAGRDARGNHDGARAEATFNEPGGIAKIGDALYVADTNNSAIRVIDMKSGKVATLTVGQQPTPAAHSEMLAPGQLPNLQTLSLQVAPGMPLEVTLQLKDGWHINAEAPSKLTLLSLSGPVASFEREALKGMHVTLPKLEESPKEASLKALEAPLYSLAGTLYYCEDKAGSLCMIKSFDVKLTPNGTDNKIMLPLN